MSINSKAITHEEYGASVVALLKIALYQHGSGAKASAQVLLSAHNGPCWQLDVTDLCGLDETNFTHAMNVIAGRVKLFTEPQDVVNDGSEHFRKLWDRFPMLHIGNRNLTQCNTCWGTGEIWEDEDDEQNERKLTCRCCQGAGYKEEPNYTHSRNVSNQFEGK